MLPPAWSVLKNRLQGRGSETPEVIDKRLGNARKEIDKINQYDYFFINDKIEYSVKNLEKIMITEQMKTLRLEVDLNGFYHS